MTLIKKASKFFGNKNVAGVLLLVLGVWLTPSDAMLDFWIIFIIVYIFSYMNS